MCEKGQDDIIERLEDLETSLSGYKEEVKIIRAGIAIITSYIIGELDTNSPGLAERVRKIEDWIANQKKLYYLVASIFITQIIGWIFVLLIK